MRSPAEAAATILAETHRLPVECIPITEVLGRIIGHDARSPIDIPARDNSAMDGYAVRAADVSPAVPVTLHIVETIVAGALPTVPIESGECARIFTGAPIPDGADSVIRQEDTTAVATDQVRIDDPRDAGRNVRPRGEDVVRGSVVLPEGSELGPAAVGMLAAIGESEVCVYRQPRVAFLGSGNELADLDERDAIVSGRKIASSNTYTLLSLLARVGATPVNLGIARDDPADVRERVSKGMLQADVIVTTAGVSVGEHDYMRPVLEELGLDLKFWRIRMRPGAPVGFGLLGGIPWIGLPGNPVSAMVTFELFVRPLIRKMRGHATWFRRAVPVRMTESIAVPTRLTHFLRAVVSERDGNRTARLTGPQGSGILSSMVAANALLIVPAERAEVDAGETLQAILLDDPVHVEAPPFE
ncbi:MAG TPA: gephyrin-like molybdotransferase Glp [Gemmatimonadales bacterium]